MEKQPHEKPSHTIQDPTMMVTVAWNPLGFHLLDVLLNGSTFNTEYYRVHIPAEFLPLRPQVDGRIVIIHGGNVRPHRARKYRTLCEANRLRLTVHPSHSPDLSPSDFFLFGYIKHCLQGIVFASETNRLQQFMESSGPSRDQSRRTCFRLGWRDSNAFLKTMVNTILQLNTSSFLFLGFLSRNEMLHLGGTPCIVSFISL
jgi:transposase